MTAANLATISLVALLKNVRKAPWARFIIKCQPDNDPFAPIVLFTSQPTISCTTFIVIIHMRQLITWLLEMCALYKHRTLFIPSTFGLIGLQIFPWVGEWSNLGKVNNNMETVGSLWTKGPVYTLYLSIKYDYSSTDVAPSGLHHCHAPDPLFRTVKAFSFTTW